MPLSGSTYVAPTWRNGGPPALDAAELQAISDSIVRNQGKNADQDTLIAALQTAVGGKAQIEVGSYVGTGTYGPNNPNSITCSFVPKLIWIVSQKSISDTSFYFPFYSPDHYNILVTEHITDTYANLKGFVRRSGNWNANDLMRYSYAKKSNSGKTVSWYINPSGITVSDPSYTQFNTSKTVFLYIVFG